MPKGLDFSTVVVETYEFTGRKGTTFFIKDDIDVDLIVRGMDGYIKLENLDEYNKTSTDEATMQRYGEVKRQIDDVFVAMIHHTDPDILEDSLASEFHFEDRVMVILFFMNRLGDRLQKRPGNISAPQTSKMTKPTTKTKRTTVH